MCICVSGVHEELEILLERLLQKSVSHDVWARRADPAVGATGVVGERVHSNSYVMYFSIQRKTKRKRSNYIPLARSYNYTVLEQNVTEMTSRFETEKKTPKNKNDFYCFTPKDVFIFNFNFNS